MGTYLRLTPALKDVLRQLLRAETEVWGLLLATETGRPTGTIYPLLERLERAGFVRSRWGADEPRPGARRRLYSLTPGGRDWATSRLDAAGAPDDRMASS
jgi:PadR family transcriptional regulator PadR